MNRHASVVLLLAGVIGVCFWSSLRHGFVNFDDPQYITANATVQSGLTWDGVRWAFTTIHAANWHPLTWLSHMVDVELFGHERAAGHRAVNLLLHLLNCVLVYLALWRLTAAQWRSTLVAVLCAIHPLHVESVVWIAERKDLLSACFGLAAIWLYAGFARRRTLTAYLLVLTCFALSLLAKPMLVTLPCVLLLLDYWPLQRMTRTAIASVFIEKIPLFLMSAASCVVTMLAQRSAGAQDAIDVSLGARLANAVVAYSTYLFKTVWPTDLAVLYPHPIHWPWQDMAISAAALVVITAIALWLRHRRDLLIGWLWFLGTLVPVIGLVQVGRQSMADRYTYIPLIGVFIMAAWSLPAFREGREWISATVTAAIIFCCAGLMLTTRMQVERWHSSVTLFEHAVAVTTNNALAHNNLGEALLREGRAGVALEHFARAVEIEPNYGLARTNLGGALLSQNRGGEALPHLREAVRLRPDFPQSHILHGLALADRGLLPQARAELETALQLNPTLPAVNRNLGQVLARMGLFDEAIAAFENELRINPNDAQAKAFIDMAQRDRDRKKN